MTKFVRVKEKPEELESGCIVIEAPNFMEEILSCKAKKPKHNLITPNYLREICAAIGDRYGDENFNAMTSVNVTPYKGVKFENLEDVAKIVNRVISDNCPGFFDSYVDHHLKNRPTGTRLVYFLGDFKFTGPFTRNGIDEVSSKDLDVYLGKKKKKTVGKPAITDKEAGTLTKD